MGSSSSQGSNIAFASQGGTLSVSIGLGNEYEGYEGRIERLFHATSPESAEMIISEGKMLRGTTGLFGGGIYFAESEGIAIHKAHFNGAIIDAFVNIGRSLICRQSRPGMTYSALTGGYNCSSVKGVGCVTNPEYVVYNWAQVFIREVRIRGKIAWTSGIAHIGLRAHHVQEAKSRIDNRHSIAEEPILEIHYARD